LEQAAALRATSTDKGPKESKVKGPKKSKVKGKNKKKKTTARDNDVARRAAPARPAPAAQKPQDRPAKQHRLSGAPADSDKDDDDEVPVAAPARAKARRSAPPAVAPPTLAKSTKKKKNTN
jgi:hypothetical protein